MLQEVQHERRVQLFVTHGLGGACEKRSWERILSWYAACPRSARRQRSLSKPVMRINNIFKKRRHVIGWSVGWFPALISVLAVALIVELSETSYAIEEGELIKKDGTWQYGPSEDPALKYLLEKRVISQEEYNRGNEIFQNRWRLYAPNFSISWNEGLNIRAGDKFLLKLRLLTRMRYNYHTYNDAWSAVGDGNNAPDFTTTLIPNRVGDASAGSFGLRTLRLQFMGHAFHPDVRYHLTLTGDVRENNFSGAATAGTVQVLNAYVAAWHFPFAILRVGQQEVWFNRENISTMATLSFVERSLIVENFTASGVNLRDFGVTLLSDENKYTFNYAFGIFNGTGVNNDRLAIPLTGASSGSRQNANELMYVARLLWNISGRPGYGEGDILYSRVPQVALAVVYAVNPGLNLLTPTVQLRNQLLTSGNGRLLGAGYVDFRTAGVDIIAKYRGWAFQAEGYYREQDVRGGGDPKVGSATGWYVMVSKYVIPRHLEVAARYGMIDPNTKVGQDLIKEASVGVTYSFDGTYNHRVLFDYTNITMGSGGFAAAREALAATSGFGRDLIENRFRMMYQIYW